MTTTGHPTIISLTLLAVVTRMGAGQEGKSPAAGKPEKLVLFDGKSLKGWKKADFFNAGEVKVEEGRIVMSAGRSMSGITSTPTDLPTTNYELSYEAMRLERARLLRRGHLPGRQVLHHAGQRRVGRQRDRPFQPRRHGCLGERDDAVVPLPGQHMVPVSRSG